MNLEIEPYACPFAVLMITAALIQLGHLIYFGLRLKTTFDNFKEAKSECKRYK
jgi:hypothetical protein